MNQRQEIQHLPTYGNYLSTNTIDSIQHLPFDPPSWRSQRTIGPWRLGMIHQPPWEVDAQDRWTSAQSPPAPSELSPSEVDSSKVATDSVVTSSRDNRGCHGKNARSLPTGMVGICMVNDGQCLYLVGFLW